MNRERESHSPNEANFGVFVAIDWAVKKCVWSLPAAHSDQRQHGEIQHQPEAVEAWVGGLFPRFPAQTGE